MAYGLYAVFAGDRHVLNLMENVQVSQRVLSEYSKITNGYIVCSVDRCCVHFYCLCLNLPGLDVALVVFL